jgi:hypothetical protein
MLTHERQPKPVVGHGIGRAPNGGLGVRKRLGEAAGTAEGDHRCRVVSFVVTESRSSRKKGPLSPLAYLSISASTRIPAPITMAFRGAGRDGRLSDGLRRFRH